MASGFDRSGQKRLSFVDQKLKMDALVSDLSLALDESDLPQYHRKRRGFKKRSKLSSSINLGINQLSGDSSSSMEEMTMSQDNKSSFPLTDSDEPKSHLEQRTRILHLTHHRTSSNMVESDSVNENISPARLERRKQKCKRLALDPSAKPSSSGVKSLERNFRGSLRRKTPLVGSPDVERFQESASGKRKRGRIEGEIGRKTHTHHHYGSSVQGCKFDEDGNLHNSPDEDMHSGHSSEGESDPGLYTCDEGREADDEQSDFFAESGPSYGIPNGQNSHIDQDSWLHPNFQLSPITKALFKERYDKMTKESYQACRIRFRKLRERVMRREIKAGKRRLHERKPGFGVITILNEKVTRFLRDPLQTELKMNPTHDRELEQLKHLADLYSLEFSTDNTQAILTKTMNTIQVRSFDITSSITCSTTFNDKKKRRRTPPPSNNVTSPVGNLTEGSNDSVESVVNNVNTLPPVPAVSWGDIADSLSERQADSEPELVPSPSSLALHDCTL